MQEMEMKIDATRIREEREKRAWTQEQLADIAGLGVRTVQRIEATGVASFESAASLSAALSIPVSELRLRHAQDSSAVRSGLRLRPHLWALTASLCAALILSPPRLDVFLALWVSLSIAFEIGFAVASKRRSS